MGWPAHSLLPSKGVGGGRQLGGREKEQGGKSSPSSSQQQPVPCSPQKGACAGSVPAAAPGSAKKAAPPVVRERSCQAAGQDKQICPEAASRLTVGGGKRPPEPVCFRLLHKIPSVFTAIWGAGLRQQGEAWPQMWQDHSLSL